MEPITIDTFHVHLTNQTNENYSNALQNVFVNSRLFILSVVFKCPPCINKNNFDPSNISILLDANVMGFDGGLWLWVC